MNTIQIVWSIILIVIWSLFIHYQGFRRGYKVGGTKVLNEWKKWMKQLEEESNDKSNKRL